MERLNIAICEDAPADAIRLRDMVCASSVPADTYVYGSADSLRAAFVPGMFQLLLLDIYLGEKPLGMELARELRASDSEVQISFTTVSPDFALEGYRVQARDYLIKPVRADDLNRLLTSVFEHFAPRGDAIEITADHRRVGVAPSQVRYIEALGKRSILHLTEGEIVTYAPLALLAGLFPALCFLHCHQSFVVNLRHVQHLTGDTASFCMDDGCHIPISRSRRSKVRAAWQDYLVHATVYHRSEELV
ncbi:MAG: LytTR family DNA-binding domain-containing protein [Coriobacteriales bacterium]|nr:LytTR family DNA-binding domain-containing protein [Coriobacteriales bacterium]